MEAPGTKIQSRVYVLDTSALIMLDVTFPSDNAVFVAVWDEMEDMIRDGTLRTIDYVEAEINEYEGKKTFLQQWTKHHKSAFVRTTTEACIIAAIPIINEEYSSGFFDAKKLAAGKEKADPYLIAYAQVNDCTVVTNENPQKPNKIPMVAQKNKVRCIGVYDFIQELGLIMVRSAQ